MNRTAVRLVGAASVGAALAAGGMHATGVAHADPLPPNCLASPWGFLGLTQVRILCDGPVYPDGSWLRHRVIGTPAHQVPITTSCYGTYYVTCTTSGGYWQPTVIVDDEIYSVTFDSIGATVCEGSGEPFRIAVIKTPEWFDVPVDGLIDEKVPA